MEIPPVVVVAAAAAAGAANVGVDVILNFCNNIRNWGTSRRRRTGHIGLHKISPFSPLVGRSFASPVVFLVEVAVEPARALHLPVQNVDETTWAGQGWPPLGLKGPVSPESLISQWRFWRSSYTHTGGSSGQEDGGHFAAL